MSEQATFIASAAVSGVGLFLAGGYLAACVLGRDPGHRALYDAPGWSAHRRRRYTATGLVAAISVAFFVGVNLIDAAVHPLLFLVHWLVVTAMLVYVCVLALADLRQTRREHHRHLAEVARKFAEAMSMPQEGTER